MQVRILTASHIIMETPEFKKLIREIGDSVHSMNTIAVGLTKLTKDNCDIPEGLDISWKTKDLETSKTKARNYAERAAIIYSVESFFEYLEKISKNPFWTHSEINFISVILINGKAENVTKAERVYNFLSQIPGITAEMTILSELACHWRNKIVHASASQAKLAPEKIGKLRQLEETIYDNYCHFKVLTALENYDDKRITLKDSSTLITILIKSARLIDEFFFHEFSLEKGLETITKTLLNKEDFVKIIKQEKSAKRQRQITTFIQMNYPFLTQEQLDKISNKINQKPRP